MVLVALVGCRTASPKNSAKVESELETWRNRVAKILQSGWEVNPVNNSLVITRKEPVTYYNSIALPAFDSDLRKQMIERGKRQESYQITIEFVERLSNEKYEELKVINAKTDKELHLMEDRMRKFASKDSYMPNTPDEQLLYQEYKTKLSTLPYQRLPDLYDEKYSIYVTTTRPPWAAFYSGREEQECRAVIENIYSYAEIYEADKLTTWPPGGSYGTMAMFECFDSGRVYDRYLHKKELNLN
jgi:hypothetical protein